MDMKYQILLPLKYSSIICVYIVCWMYTRCE